MRALACPASLKGVLSATDAAAALAAGFRLAGVDVDECPIADGGEGTADALFAALGGEWREAVVADPLGRPIRARWLLLPTCVAVVESAEAIGLDVRGSAIRCASSRGLGELIRAARAEWPAGLVVGLGGTATMDGGAGMREVLSSLPVGTVALCDVRTRPATPPGSTRPRRAPRRTTFASSSAARQCRDLTPFAERPQLGLRRRARARRSRRSVPASFPEPAGSSSASTFARTCATPTWP